jgi:tRNA nucleotidyltransferase (CCA-adding enzyme)
MPKHYGHEVSGVPVARSFCERLSMPAKLTERVCKTTLQHMKMHQLDILNNKTIVDMFDNMNALNDHRVVEMLHEVGIADHRGRLGSENDEVESLSKVMKFFEAYKSVKFADVFPNGEKNVQRIKDGMHRSRVQAVKEVRNV